MIGAEEAQAALFSGSPVEVIAPSGTKIPLVREGCLHLIELGIDSKFVLGQIQEPALPLVECRLRLVMMKLEASMDFLVEVVE